MKSRQSHVPAIDEREADGGCQVALAAAGWAEQQKIGALLEPTVACGQGFEMNVESYRRRAALDRKRAPGRPPTHATIKEKA